MQRPLLVLVSFLLLSCSVAVAEEGSVLDRLQAETRAIAEATGRALLPVLTDHAAGRAHWGDRAFWAYKKGVRLHRHGTPTTAVLIGQPPRLVVSYVKDATLHIGLKGRSVEATRVDGDPELGVSVYALPAEEAKRLRGLTVEKDWTQLQSGSLAIAAGRGDAELTLLRGADRRSGRLDASHAQTGAILVGTGGRLLGMRTTTTTHAAVQTSCGDCHASRPASSRLRLLAADRAYAAAAGYAALATKAQTATIPEYVAGPVIHRVLDDIEQHGRIRHSYLGVVLGETVGRGGEAGVVITAVLDGSPAQAAGLKAGQRVAAIDGLTCATADALSRALVLRRPDETVTLALVPDGTEVKVTLADRAAAQKHFVTPETVGLTCVEIDPGLRRYLGLEADLRGVVVHGVQHGSPAFHAGFQRGDVVVWGGGGAIGDLEELQAALAAAKGSVVLRAYRGEDTLEYTVKIPDAKGSTR
ncbi:MAG: PDZ domain-containing protein [Planctomycetota bacterium]|jgi:membrane-associated protease RseP (regulator of RpoE activity)